MQTKAFVDLQIAIFFLYGRTTGSSASRVKMKSIVLRKRKAKAPLNWGNLNSTFKIYKKVSLNSKHVFSIFFVFAIAIVVHRDGFGQ
jgi:hypothetical protein